jgi:hypothetical protein
MERKWKTSFPVNGAGRRMTGIGGDRSGWSTMSCWPHRRRNSAALVQSRPRHTVAMYFSLQPDAAVRRSQVASGQGQNCQMRLRFLEILHNRG